MRYGVVCRHTGWERIKVTHTLWGDIREVRCSNCRVIERVEYPKGLRRIGNKHEKTDIERPPKPEVGGF